MATEPESVYLCSKDDKHPEMGLADLACAGALDGLGSGASHDERGPVEAPSPRGYEHLVCSNGSLALDADRPVDAFDAPVEGVFQVGSGWAAKAVDLQFSRAVSFESDSEDDEEDGSYRDGEEEEKHYADPDEAHHDAVRWKLELGRDAPPRAREKTAEERARDRLSRATVVAYLCILCVVVVAIVVCLLLFWQRGPDDDDDAAAAAAAAADSNATAAGERRRRV